VNGKNSKDSQSAQPIEIPDMGKRLR